ncbi:MAG: hypothetical protein NVSMB4_14940 [Acidimicrobiales bacterium]
MIDLRTTSVCTCSFQTAFPDHHDRLLQLEGDGIYGATELIELALTWDELDYSDQALIGPDDWAAFVSAHHWHDATAVAELIEVALDCARIAPTRRHRAPATLPMFRPARDPGAR